MSHRVDPYAAAPALLKTWLDFSTLVAQSGLEESLLELVKLRASQINGCANCVNMHSFEARRAGETEQRIALLPVWEEAPCFTDRERVALSWVDHLTLIADMRAPKAVYDALAAEFTEEEQVQLTLAISVINGWNRIAVGFDMFAPERGWQA
jgi:AhpD family alkylhydroperoxidase